MATQILQLTGGVEQLPSNALSYDATAIGTLAVANGTSNASMFATNANTTVGLDVLSTNAVSQMLATNANTVAGLGTNPGVVWRTMQWKISGFGWLTQYDTDPGQLTAQNGYPATFLAYDRKVPGGGADPGSGKIVQLEVPTSNTGNNPMAQMLPFPSISVAP
jgi:hypothetical protein